MMKIEMKDEWVLCPVCKSKTRVKARKDQIVLVIKEPDAEPMNLRDNKSVINRQQELIVVRLYQEFLDGKTTDYIKRIFEKEGIKNWDGGTKWQATTLMSMLENKKYKGDALLQKSYTVDFLTKRRSQNKGEIQMFYMEDDHNAIISK